jgi:hypothetical protein
MREEVGVMMAMLQDAGIRVIVASEYGQHDIPLVGHANEAGEQMRLDPELKYSEVNVEDFDGLIIPCLPRGRSIIRWRGTHSGADTDVHRCGFGKSQ